ncbi:HugZ family protein [Albidovulum sp.]|uniref:HugZ family pyridoxamine 5'-phosphate oxidase n=1 Tax=Albidovulum sp. TaxID=1872424 RepID=UPI0039B8E9F4
MPPSPETPRRIDPIRPTDADARGIARALLTGARTAALGVLDPATGAPFVSRVAFGLGPAGVALTLVSDLAFHAGALRADPRVSLLLGEPGPKGDPLVHPRLTLAATARFVATDAPERAALREAWLGHHPKAALYVDFADFHFVRFEIASGHLNAGFGKAYALDANDLKLQS